MKGEYDSKISYKRKYMKKTRKNILYLTIIVLIIVIAIIIGVVMNLSESNKIIESKETSTEQLTQTTSSNAYVDMATHLSEISATERKEASGTITAKGKTTVVCGFRPRIVSIQGGWGIVWVEPHSWFGDEHLYSISISNSTVNKKALGDKLIINDDGFTFTISSNSYETTWYASE